MNYCGRVIGDDFSEDFLKTALKKVPLDKPFRGPEFYQEDNYTYHCKVDGDVQWYQGYEEIYNNNSKTYECYFHEEIIVK